MSQVNASLNQLKSEPFDEKTKQKTDALVRDEQENYDEALTDLRKLVDSASQKYAELQEDSSIKKALRQLAKTAKVKPKLGPSPHYLTTVKLLDKLEKEKTSSAAADSLDDSPKASSTILPRSPRGFGRSGKIWRVGKKQLTIGLKTCDAALFSTAIDVGEKQGATQCDLELDSFGERRATLPAARAAGFAAKLALHSVAFASRALPVNCWRVVRAGPC